MSLRLSGSSEPATSRRRRLAPASAGLFAIGLLVLAPACNEHTFEVIEPCAIGSVEEQVPLEAAKKADILLVIDNSGSMCEEQANLALNFFDSNCPITDLNNIPKEYKNPPNDVVNELAKDCGFIQILAAYDNDFRVGVITTDVGPCDNRFGYAESETVGIFQCDGEPFPNWGRRPQRGCLQAPDYAEQKFIRRTDTDIAQRFNDTLDVIETFGTGFERGLDAMDIFLNSAGDDRTAGCETDGDDFLRDDAQLVVIFLTDEEDCSHEPSDVLPDENDGESCTGLELSYSQRPVQLSTESCYTETESLTPVSHYVEALKDLRGDDVRVAVIAGGLFDDDGNVTAGACRVGGGGAPDSNCHPSHGNSNFNAANQQCDPTRVQAEHGFPECCEADAGDRYFSLARAFGEGKGLMDSICFESFRSTMVQIAQFAARVDQVVLPEKPASPAAIIVKILRSGKTEPELIDRIPDGKDPTDESGWQLEGDQTIRFYGDAAPQPGDEVQVSSLATRGDDEEESCTGF